MRENADVRKMARVADVRLYQVAQEIGISEPTLQRWLRKPLSKEHREAIVCAIIKIERASAG